MHRNLYHWQRDNEDELQFRPCLLCTFSKQTRLESISSRSGESHIKLGQDSSVLTTQAFRACNLRKPHQTIGRDCVTYN